MGMHLMCLVGLVDLSHLYLMCLLFAMSGGSIGSLRFSWFPEDPLGTISFISRTSKTINQSACRWSFVRPSSAMAGSVPGSQARGNMMHGLRASY